MENLKVIRVGSGKERTSDGQRKKIRGYAPRVGKALSELLKENQTIKVVAMGEASTNNMVKAIAHAQSLLAQEDKSFTVYDFLFEDAEVTDRDGKEVVVKTLSVKISLD